MFFGHENKFGMFEEICNAVGKYIDHTASEG
jgi:hypothetical protein